MKHHLGAREQPWQGTERVPWPCSIQGAWAALPSSHTDRTNLTCSSRLLHAPVKQLIQTTLPPRQEKPAPETGKAPRLNLATELGQNPRMLGSRHLSQAQAADPGSVQRCLKWKVPSSASLPSLAQFLHVLYNLHPALGAQPESRKFPDCLGCRATGENASAVVPVVLEQLDSLTATQRER